MPQKIYKSLEDAQAAWDRGEIEGDEDYFPGSPQGMAGLAKCRYCGTKEPMLWNACDIRGSWDDIYVLCADCNEKYTGVVYDICIPDPDGLVDSVLIRMGKVVGGKWRKE